AAGIWCREFWHQRSLMGDCLCQEPENASRERDDSRATRENQCRVERGRPLKRPLYHIWETGTSRKTAGLLALRASRLKAAVGSEQVRRNGGASQDALPQLQQQIPSFLG